MYTMNKSVVLAGLEAIQNDDWETFNKYCHEDLIEHNTPPIQNLKEGRDGVRQTFEMLRTGFPDLRFEVIDVVCENNKVVVYSRMLGTHSGNFMGFPATGKPIDQTNIDIFKLEDGRVVEHWGVNDSLGLLQQIGVIPMLTIVEPAAAAAV